ncbi:hypothetical protein BSPWISOXPB_10355 [uncultured Gammaproteobacteria bacterium]|nr:hypothetical protein BSPWISOXPB_10355 [uncultured Gammaproteobacteria bacterium]
MISLESYHQTYTYDTGNNLTTYLTKQIVVLGNKPSPSTQTTTAAPKPSRVPLTLMLMAIY